MIGKTYAQYEITEQIGAGGMGAVYRARDTRLDRDVAIKVIPFEMSGDPEREARFQREAKTLATLQHPNIAAIYGYEEVDGLRFLVMELVEGADLATRLKSGRLPEDEAVEIIRHVAAGLTEAHRNGIVHRDLKPANIMLTSDGTVKILDFGLARANTGDDDSSDAALSPTITAAMTQAGTILGTAAYMAPEQARGKRVDHRADIWALGAILCEMLTGRRLFEGETVTDVLASVIKLEPDLDALPPGTSPQVRRMLRRCLQRDPRKRLYAAADAVLELDEPATEFGTAPAGRSRTVLPWAAAAVLAAALAVVLLRPATAPEIARRHYEIQLPSKSDGRSPYRPLVSPDGNWLAGSIRDSLGVGRIMLRSLETGQVRWLENTMGADFAFWSPDSRYLGFFQDGRMRKLHLESGSTQVITTDVRTLFRGGTWAPDGQVLYAPGSNDGLFLIDAEGGPMTPVTELDTTMADGSHRWPEFLPDGRRFVFTQWSNVLDERSAKGGIFLGSRDGDAPRRLLRDVSAAMISPTGHLLFHRNGRLMAMAFDLDAGTVSGEPRVVAEKVAFQTENGMIGASVDGQGNIFLSDHDPESGLRLGWVGRDGEVRERLSDELSLSFNLALSADGSHYAAELLDDVGSVEVWIGDVARGSISRLSRFENDCGGVVFSPDGREVIYGVLDFAGTKLYRHDITGARDAELIVDFGRSGGYRDGAHWFAADEILIVGLDQATKYNTIKLVDLNTGTESAVLSGDFNQEWPRLSPDERWLAYVADDSGTPEIYLRSWPDLGRKWQVSREGGVRPHWNREGTELTFEALARREIRGVDVDGRGDAPQLSLPRVVTSLPEDVLFVTNSADHQRYLAGFSLAAPELPPVQVMVGWWR